MSSTADWDEDDTCEGDCSSCIGANTVFEAGTGVIKSAGNLGNIADPDDCTLGPPAAAIDVLAVGDYSWVRAADQTPCQRSHTDCTDEAIDASPSRGGTATEGNGRSLIALAAPEGFQYSYPHYHRPTDDSTLVAEYYRSDGNPADGWVDGSTTASRGAYGAMTATSAATPQVTGTAALFREWFLDDSYDGLWGAGRLRARRFNGSGLDATAWYGTASFCVDDAEVLYVGLNQDIYGNAQAAASGTDYVKTSTWMDDTSTESAVLDLDTVELQLQRQTTGAWSTVLTGAPLDEKQRFYVEGSSVPGAKWRLRIEGVDVAFDEAGCGTNSQRLYVAALMEDNARNDVPACVDPEP